MSDPISTCNEAIVELGGGEFGAPRLLSFADGTSLSTICGEMFPGARDMALSMHPWNWASVRKTLSRSPDTPDFGWQYMYQLPTEPYCLKVRATNYDPGDRWEVGTDVYNGRVIYSDRPSLGIVYTRRVEDLTSWDAIALQVLIKVIASKLAKPLTGQNSLTELKLREAYSLLPEAKHADGREGTPAVLTPNTALTLARQRHGGTFPYGTIVVD